MKDPEKLAIRFLAWNNGISIELAEAKYDHFSDLPEYDQVPEAASTESTITDAGCPEWLTPEHRKHAREIWDSHRTVDDHLRVDAISYIRDLAKVSGYVITISKALELFEKYCKNYEV